MVIEEEIPTLGICLGMQLLTKQSEEGESPGLGFVNATVGKFRFEKALKLKAPHMGWNIAESRKYSKIHSNLFSENRFYFAHSYYVLLDDMNDEILSTHYGFEFTAGFENRNILDLQFHPEKSHKFGMAILNNFIYEF